MADALPSSFDGFPRRHGSVNAWRMYQQSAQLEAAAAVLNCASHHASHSGGTEAEAILSRLRDQVIAEMNAPKGSAGAGSGSKGRRAAGGVWRTISTE